MAVELDELTLTVTLDDQASEQLGNLHKALGGIVMAAGPAQQGLQQLGQSLRGASSHAQGLHGSLGGLAARGGFIGGFFFEVGRQLEQMVKEFSEAVFDIKAYADTMVKLDQVSSRAATSMGQFRANVAVFRESGIGGEQASKMLAGYADALADLQRPESRIRMQLLAGQRGEYRERMEDLLRTVMTSDQQTGINAIREAGRRIREEWERRGQPERGAGAEASFFARMGMPGLEKVRGQLQSISAEEERMYNDRRRDAQRYQTALEKQADAWDRGVKSIQAIAFELLPIAGTAEKGAGVFNWLAESAESYERNLRKARTATENTTQGLPWWAGFDPRNISPSLGGPYADQLIRAERAREIVLNPPPMDQTPTGMDIEFDPFKNAPNRRRGAATGTPDYYRRMNLLGGEADTGGGGAGRQLDVAALGIPSIGELLKPDPNAIVAPSQPGEFAGAGWRGLPMSKNIIDLRGRSSEVSYLEGQSERMGLLTDEVNRLNEFLAPELMRMLLEGTGAPPFHNAPQGGTEGESNPIQIPPGARQPGGGAAAEARQALLRPWKPGDPVVGTYGKGGAKKWPILGPEATALPRQTPTEPTYSGVSQGRGVASYYGYDPAYGIDPSDPLGSNKLRVPERYQGISLSTGKSGALGTTGQTLGQFHYVTDPNTGLTHVMQQTDVGPGVRTQKIVDIAAEKALRMGYRTRREFEAQQGRVERGEVAPWEVRPTGFGTYGRPGVEGRDIDAPMIKGVDPTITTQNIRELDTGKLIDPRLVGGQRGTTPGGVDMTFGGGSGAFDVGGLYAGGASRGELDAYSGPEEGVGKGFRLGPGTDVASARLSGQADVSDIEWSSRIPMRNLGDYTSENIEDRRDTAYNQSPRGGTWEGGQYKSPPETEAFFQRGFEPVQPSFGADWEQSMNLNPSLREVEKIQAGPNRFDPRTGRPLDGSVIDSAARAVDVNQTGRLTVDVNAPAGTSVSAEGGGVFNQTETNRSVPMESATAE